MVLKKDGRYSLRKHSLPGTLGQCLMEAPDTHDRPSPYVWYLYGGCIFNLVACVLFGVLAAFVHSRNGSYHLLVFFVFLSLAGLFDVIVNGIPVKMGPVPNDAYNVRLIPKEPYALRSLWLQLKVNAASQAYDMRIKDMPAEWFALPDDMSAKEVSDKWYVLPDDFIPENELTSMMLVFAVSCCMDMKDFQTAEKLIDQSEHPDCVMMDLYRHLLQLDKLFIRILEKGPETDLSVLEDKQIKGIRHAMKNYPSVIRTEYAIAKGVRQNEAEAAGCLERFEKCAKTFPSRAEIASERELMTLVG